VNTWLLVIDQSSVVKAAITISFMHLPVCLFPASFSTHKKGENKHDIEQTLNIQQQITDGHLVVFSVHDWITGIS
jgi:hypothetical protein